jgi:hypothetical protein
MPSSSHTNFSKTANLPFNFTAACTAVFHVNARKICIQLDGPDNYFPPVIKIFVGNWENYVIIKTLGLKKYYFSEQPDG